MASKIYEDGEGEMISDINVTPFVDVTLVLLVIFMVTAPMLAKRGLLLDTPKTVAGESVSDTPLSITLDKSNTLRFGTEIITDNKVLEQKLKAWHLAQPEGKVVIEADSELSYGRAMEVLDAVTTAGITKVRLATERKAVTP